MTKESGYTPSNEEQQRSPHMSLDLAAFYTLAKGEPLSVFGSQARAVSRSMNIYKDALEVQSPQQAFGMLLARESLVLPDEFMPAYPENLSLHKKDVDTIKAWVEGKSVGKIAVDLAETEEEVVQRMSTIKESVGAASDIQVVAVLQKEGFIAVHWDDEKGFSFEPRDDFDTKRILGQIDLSIQFSENLPVAQKELLALIHEGLTRAEVAERLGISYRNVIVRLSKLNARLRTEGKAMVQFTEEDTSDLELLSLIEQRLTRAEVAERLGISEIAVYSRFRRLNSKLRKEGKPMVHLAEELTVVQQGLLALIEQGLTRAEAAQRLHIVQNDAQSLLERLNARLETKGMPAVAFTQELTSEQQLFVLIEAGLQRDEIAQRMHMSSHSVRNLLWKVNVRLRKENKPEIHYKSKRNEPPDTDDVTVLDEPGNTADSVDATTQSTQQNDTDSETTSGLPVRQYELLSLIEQGFTRFEIAEKMGIPPNAVGHLLARLNGRLRKEGKPAVRYIDSKKDFVLSPLQEALIVLIDEGLTRTEAAARMGVSENTIRHSLDGLNVRLAKEDMPIITFKDYSGDFSPQQQELMSLIYDGASAGEVAQRFGISETSVHVLLNNVNKLLRRAYKLEMHFIDESIPLQGDQEVVNSEIPEEKLVALINEGITTQEAAERFGMTVSDIYFSLMKYNQQRRIHRKPILYFHEAISSSQGIIESIAQGQTNEQIADSLAITSYEVVVRTDAALAYFGAERKEELPFLALQRDEVAVESLTGIYPVENVLLLPPFYREILESSLVSSDPIEAYEAVAGKITADNYVNYVYYTQEVLRTLGVKDLSVAKFIYLLALKKGVITSVFE